MEQRKIELVKVLIRVHIMENRPLVRLGCREEVECYQDYLEELKDRFMKYPINQLEAMARGAQAAAA